MPEISDEFLDLAKDLVNEPRSERIEALFNRGLYDYQKAIADDENSNVVVTCGRQVGKTEVAGAIAGDALLFGEGDVMVAARWQDTANETFRRMIEHFERSDIPIEGFGVEKDNRTEWELSNGRRAYSRNLDATGGLEEGDTERGKVPQTVIVDESAMFREDKVFTEIIMPMFATFSGDHELYLFSTPRGRNNYHYEKHKQDDDWSSHHVPTSANPAVSEDWLQDRKAEVDGITWRQEYLGKFVQSGEDKYLDRDDIRRCVAPGDLNEAPSLQEEPTYLGVDVARKGDDRTVYIIMDEAGDVIRTEHEDENKLTEVVARVRTLDARYHFNEIRVDENAMGGGVVDFTEYDLGGKMRPTKFSRRQKQQMYQSLKKCIEEGELSFPENERLIHELSVLEYSYTPTGKLKVGHPPGEHDDYADALALANYARVGAGSIRGRRPRGKRPR